MCLLFFAYKCSSFHNLVVAANRDEFLDRQTVALHVWDGPKKILGGRDLRGGGTWMGVSEDGKFAAITNFRGPRENNCSAPSRGELISDFLADDMSGLQYGQIVEAEGHKYNGFNLVFGDKEQLYYYCNRNGGVQKLEPGFYGLSNHFLDTPWPKIKRGKKLLNDIMTTTSAIDIDRIWKHLGDTLVPPDEELPDTGVGLVWERLLSSIFIDSSLYGTRSSAVVTITSGGLVDFYEKSYIRTSSSKLISKLEHLSYKS